MAQPNYTYLGNMWPVSGSWQASGNNPGALPTWDPSNLGNTNGTNYLGVAGGIGDQNLNYNKAAGWLDWSFNRNNQDNPYGNLSYRIEPDGTITQQTRLTDAQQNILDSENAAAATKANSISNLARVLGGEANVNVPTLSYSKLPSLDYGSRLQNQTTNSAYQKATDLLKGSFADEAKIADAQLAARGIPVGSELYNNIAKERDQRRNEAYTKAASDAITLGQNAADLAFNQSLGARSQVAGEQQDVANSKASAAQFSYLYPMRQAQALSGLSPVSGAVQAPTSGSQSAIGVNNTAYMDTILNLGQLAQQGKISQGELDAKLEEIAAATERTRISSGASVQAAKLAGQTQMDLARLQLQALLGGE